MLDKIEMLIANASLTEIYITIAVLIILLTLIIYIIADFFSKPFKYPHIITDIDISGKRKPSYEDYIDEWIIEHRGKEIAQMFNDEVAIWESKCQKYIKRAWFWKKRKGRIFKEMYAGVMNRDYLMFRFVFFRTQTRYRQANYKKYAYKVDNVETTYRYSLQDLLEIDDELEEIDYETTRQKYYAKNQRKLMTKELRRRIIERDNYTCQNCGKYMPDEVGLHVDHIVSIKNGGKTVESNLQVLCDKCNLSKGARRK